MIQCLNCKSNNPDSAKFCKNCGRKIELICTECHRANSPGSRFCNECGISLAEPVAECAPELLNPSDIEGEEDPFSLTDGSKYSDQQGERKYATILFSDLSGYTAMSEKLDPEDVKEITGRIFGEVASVVAKYEGQIEKYIGDAVMAVFGVPVCHEDDAVRAILAAQEIHAIVDGVSPDIESKIGCPLRVHTGINTGLIVTGKMEIEKGVLGVVGDTVNVAARLEGLSGAGEIFVGRNTYNQARERFDFETQESAAVKGKSRPVLVYKVTGAKGVSKPNRRFQGMRTGLVGRKMEFSQLQDILSSLEKGTGAIVSVSGEAGTGKSRLVEELKLSIDYTRYQWLEGHAYSYSQNISYSPLIGLMNQVFTIREDDSSTEVKKKLHAGINAFFPGEDDLIPIIEVLYSVRDRDAEQINPQFWMLKLREIIQRLFKSISRKAFTIICLEDLHWADPSSMDLMRSILSEIRIPVVVLCIYRPTIHLFEENLKKRLPNKYCNIELKPLSPSESYEMVERLLKTDDIPVGLREFIQNKAEGNPFYLEEMVSSMIESGELIKENGQWHMRADHSGTQISSTIHGVISARIDRLCEDAKVVLQEAAVMGRSFYRQVLSSITQVGDGFNQSLETLQELDLIRQKDKEPYARYMFKHALAQDVVYNGLLKSERRLIHGRIGEGMERFFKTVRAITIIHGQASKINKGVARR